MNMIPEDLQQMLHIQEVDQTELEYVLLSHFSRARQESPNNVVYSRSGDGNALTLTYDDNGVLINLERGEQITEDDLRIIAAKIEKELLSSSSSKIGRLPLFVNVPVNGCFRYEDIFQISPPPTDAPKPNFLAGDNPFLLEFKFMDSDNFVIRNMRRTIRVRELELLLSTILNPPIRSLGRTSRHHWVASNLKPKEPVSVVYLPEMYSWPGLKVEDANFSQIDGIPSLAKIDPDEYYSRSGITPSRGFDIPLNLENLLEIFFHSPLPIRKQFLNAAFWFQHANRAWSDSRSASYTALISAVECLMPRKKLGFCKVCKRTIENRTQQFVDFVDTMSPGTSQEKERKEFYRTRSALSHGGKLLHSDYATWGSIANPSIFNETLELGTIFNLVRRVIVNWLNSSPQP